MQLNTFVLYTEKVLISTFSCVSYAYQLKESYGSSSFCRGGSGFFALGFEWTENPCVAGSIPARATPS